MICTRITASTKIQDTTKWPYEDTTKTFLALDHTVDGLSIVIGPPRVLLYVNPILVQTFWIPCENYIMALGSRWNSALSTVRGTYHHIWLVVVLGPLFLGLTKSAIVINGAYHDVKLSYQFAYLTLEVDRLQWKSWLPTMQQHLHKQNLLTWLVKSNMPSQD